MRKYKKLTNLCIIKNITTHIIFLMQIGLGNKIKVNIYFISEVWKIIKLLGTLNVKH